MTRILCALTLTFCGIYAIAQTAITPKISPDFFTPEDEITISYNVSNTALSGLSDAWIWLWLPDLNNVDVPSNVNPANSNSALTDKAKFTRSVVNGSVTYSITLKLTDFTNKSASEIKRVGILLKGNDWSNGQTTDYVFDIPEGFSLKVNSPTSTSAFYESGDIIKVDVATSESATIKILLDNSEQISETGVTALLFNHPVVADGQVHNLEISATNGTDVASFRHTYSITPTVTEENIPSGIHNGINYHEDDNTKATLVLVAPNKKNVYVLGDFNNWELNQNYLMKRDGDRFWLTIENLTPKQEYIYQYLIDGDIKIADPYSEKVSSSFDDPEIIADNRYPGLKAFPSAAKHEATYLQTGKDSFDWEVTDFTKPKPEDLVIYELLIRDFTDERTYQSVTDRLDYLDSLGINALQLMPITEFEGNLSWGYNPSYMFAPDKYYGTETQLKELIDEAHKRGIAVILDMVLNHHFGRSPMVKMYASGDFGPPTSANVWFNVTPKHDFNVGYDMNHESIYTQEYFNDVVRYWINEYHVDGYRFDLSKGFTQKNTLGNVGAWGNYDINRINLWNKYAGFIRDADPEAYVILEHFADNNEETALSSNGMMLWGNMNGTFRSTAKQRTDNLNWLYFKDRGWTKPGVVGYMESHDEERVMWDAAKSSTKSLGFLINRLELNAAFFFMVPGPKMIWQFGETGYDEELNNDRLGIKPAHWDYLEDEDRVRLFTLYQALINLKTKTDYVKDEYFSWQSSGAVKWINYDGPDLKISIFGNFDKQTQTSNPHFVSAGDWYDYFTGEKITVTDPNADVQLVPGEFYVYVSKQIENYISLNPINFITGVTTINREIVVYPNPSTSFISVKSINEIESIKVFDLSGAVILQAVRPRGIVSVEHLAKGTYLYEITTNDNQVSRGKFIKQ